MFVQQVLHELPFIVGGIMYIRSLSSPANGLHRLFVITVPSYFQEWKKIDYVDEMCTNENTSPEAEPYRKAFTYLNTKTESVICVLILSDKERSRTPFMFLDLSIILPELYVLGHGADGNKIFEILKNIAPIDMFVRFSEGSSVLVDEFYGIQTKLCDIVPFDREQHSAAIIQLAVEKRFFPFEVTNCCESKGTELTEFPSFVQLDEQGKIAAFCFLSIDEYDPINNHMTCLVHIYFLYVVQQRQNIGSSAINYILANAQGKYPGHKILIEIESAPTAHRFWFTTQGFTSEENVTNASNRIIPGSKIFNPVQLLKHLGIIEQTDAQD
jgi:hypothetical protein